MRLRRGAESDAGLLQSSGSWATDAANLRQQLDDYLGAAGAGVELICTENNSVYSNPGKQTTSLVNGLFLADSIGAAMKTAFNGVIWWDMRNGQDTANNNSSSLYGWRLYGDLAWGHCLLSIVTVRDEPTIAPDVYLFLGDRYWWLARRHFVRGRQRRAERLVRRARRYFRLGGGPEPPPLAAASLPLPHVPSFTSAVGLGSRSSGHGNAA